MTQPRFTVVVPAHDAAATLGRCLAAIEDNGFPRGELEIVVVDDASSDDTVAIAAQYADALVRLPDVPRGPAYARNRGAETAHGELLLFVDADVVLHRGTLMRLSQHFFEHGETVAVIGRYGLHGGPADLLSIYGNARWHHQHGAVAGDVATFWGACGAIRADVFHEVGRFNDWHFSAPPAEDVELGRRLHARGLRVQLLPELEVTHLRAWSLRDLLARDSWRRGLRVSRLLGDATIRPRPAGANGMRQRIPSELLFLTLAALAALAALGTGTGMDMLLGAALALLLVLELPFFAHFASAVGALRALVMLPVHIACEAVTGAGLVSGWMLKHLVGAPRPDPTVEALSEVGVRSWPPLPTKR